ncbi:MGMT family protein [Clostridium polynesiense]|uniref:MGMT family protein n=1 Tax=Clostridium polynesiense TaxID=1325933 RepID=UPI00058CB023|nr:methylated-DNA--[protein]-cysteine S-methyltransferase [Clostridium polynesiense]
MKDFYRRVYEVAAGIPKGKVMTYGQIARLIGEPRSARIVGYAMKSIPEGMKIPAHRVVNRLGEMAPDHVFGSKELQREILLSEGVIFKENGWVDMEKSQYKTI